MWDCAKCGKRMFKNSGVHRMIRTQSGNFRVAGLCPACAACQDSQHSAQNTWKTMLVFSAVAVSAGLAAFVIMVQ